MKNTPSLYHTLITLLEQPANWLDRRHLKTLVWMVIGLIESGLISLTEWSTFTDSRARYAQSTTRRFSRWLHNKRIDVHQLYAPLIASALTEWTESTLYIALDTSILNEKFCLIRVALVYRGRAIPLAWQVIEQSSAMVAFDQYRSVLDQVAEMLPFSATVVLLTDRGFADTNLMAYCDEFLGWQWRIRCKSSFYVYRSGQKATQVGRLKLKFGQARCLHGIRITKKRFGPVHLAIAKVKNSKEKWFVLSSQPTDLATFVEYGWRFDIEESFLDDKSNGFQVEDTRLNCAEALTRLCFVLAVATLVLTVQGTDVVETEQRRLVDAHWFRGSSYLKIGWRWIRRAVVKGWQLLTRLALSPLPDLEPSFASKSDVNKTLLELNVTYSRHYEFAT